jgi:3-oxoacyl-[acyl-carrier-protein] synthase II
MRRVVITGIGLLTPLGIGTAASWQGLIDGRSGLAPIQSFDASSLRTQVAGEISDFVPPHHIKNRRSLRFMTRGDQLAFTAVQLALHDAGLEAQQLDSERTALFIGSNKDVCDPGHFTKAALDARDATGQADYGRFAKSAYASVYPLVFVEGLPASSLFFLSEEYGLKGPNGFFVGTADASAVAIGRAYRALRRGEADRAIAGGFDAAVFWLTLVKLEALGVTATHEYCPYDKNRSGCVIGEGAAFLILEEYESALKQNKRIYAELTGFGSAYDAYRLISPHPEGRGLALAIQSALREAGTSPASIDYIVSHGSGTQSGDSSETAALRTVFGHRAKMPVGSSVKPATGHTVAAAGALNAAVAALAIHHQIMPPTLNLHELDPDCALDWIPLQARTAQVQETIALARGLEGQNVALSLRRLIPE